MDCQTLSTSIDPHPLKGDHYEVTITEKKVFTPGLFSFQVERPRTFRFNTGEFAMIGLEREGEKPLYRAYSLASPEWESYLEFYSIAVPDGPLTSRLVKCEPGDKILLKPRATGTLVHAALMPGRNLFLLATGTGVAPFAGILQDPATYERFKKVILVHCVRDIAEHGFTKLLPKKVHDCSLIFEHHHMKYEQLLLTTREFSENEGRITTWIKQGWLGRHFKRDDGMLELNPFTDRVMVCGSLPFCKEVAQLLQNLSFKEGSLQRPADFVIERAFVG